MSSTKKNTPRNRLAFAAMATTYCLGAFNDNYFKQAAMLLAVSAGMSHLQGWATALFALPFILFSAFGGWCADRYAKRGVIIAVKGLELVAMLVGGAGLLLESWPLILAMVFLMGLQSTFFSPALNGSIPEMYSTGQVPRVNAILKLATTLAILLGIALAGISLDQSWLDSAEIPHFSGHQVAFGVALVALAAVLVALVGFLASFALGRRPAAGGTESFPWFGPLRSLTDLVDVSRDRQLMLGIICDAWFYFLSILAVQLINTLGIGQFSFSQSQTSLLSMSLMLGVCAGSFVAAKLTIADTWSRYLKMAALGMGLCIALAGLSPLFPNAFRFAWLVITLTAAGCAGGIFIIPTATVLQVRPKESEKGRVLAVASFCSFAAILLAGLLFTAFDGHFSPALLMVATGLLAMVFALFLGLLIRLVNHQPTAPPSPATRRFLGFFAKRILTLRYRVQVEGLENIEKKGKGGILFLPNHPALIDPVIVGSQLFADFAPRPLVDAAQLEHPAARLVVGLLKPIPIPDSHDGAAAKKKILRGMQLVVAALEEGENILLYPAGRLTRSSQESLGANSAVEYILKKIPEVQIVLVRSQGLWGSSFSRAGGKPQLFARLGRSLAALAAGLLFFVPKRPVRLEFVEESRLNELEGRQQINRHLEEFYNASPCRNTRYPLFWWQGSEGEILPEPVPESGPSPQSIAQSLAALEPRFREERLS